MKIFTVEDYYWWWTAAETKRRHICTYVHTQDEPPPFTGTIKVSSYGFILCDNKLQRSKTPSRHITENFERTRFCSISYKVG